MKNYQKGFVSIILIVVAVAIIAGGTVVWRNPDARAKVGLGCKQMNWNSTFCVDAMPDFPEKIGAFTLTRYNKANWERECQDYNGNSVCAKSIRLEYFNDDQTMLMGVSPLFIDTDKHIFLEYMGQFKGKEILSNIFELKTKSLMTKNYKVFWRSRDIDMISVSQYAYKKNADGSLKNISIPKNSPLLTDEVFTYFSEKYPAVK